MVVATAKSSPSPSTPSVARASAWSNRRSPARPVLPVTPCPTSFIAMLCALHASQDTTNPTKEQAPALRVRRGLRRPYLQQFNAQHAKPATLLPKLPFPTAPPAHVARSNRGAAHLRVSSAVRFPTPTRLAQPHAMTVPPSLVHRLPVGLTALCACASGATLTPSAAAVSLALHVPMVRSVPGSSSLQFLIEASIQTGSFGTPCHSWP